MARHPGSARAALIACGETVIRACQALRHKIRGRAHHQVLWGLVAGGLALSGILSPILNLRGLSTAALGVDLFVGIVGVIVAMREAFVLPDPVQPATGT